MIRRLRSRIRGGTRRLGLIFGNAFAVYGAHSRTLILAGLIIFVPAAGLEAGAEAFAEAQVDRLPFDGVLVLLVAAGTNTLAYQMYKGVATHASLLWRQDEADISVRDVLHRLPYLQLVLVDVILTFGTAAGTLMLVVPGVLFGTYFSLAPVVVEIDECSAWQGLKRSARLVRGNFALVLMLQLIVLVVTSVFQELFTAIGQTIIPGSSPIDDAIALGALTAFLASMLIKPISALAVIELTQELREGRSRPRPLPAS